MCEREEREGVWEGGEERVCGRMGGEDVWEDERRGCVGTVADPGIRQWGGAVILEGRHILERALAPSPPSGAAEGIYDWGGGLPKARIIKFINFNGGICSPISFRPPGGGGGGGGGVRNYIERSSMATDLNFSGCHYIN